MPFFSAGTNSTCEPQVENDQLCDPNSQAAPYGGDDYNCISGACSLRDENGEDGYLCRDFKYDPYFCSQFKLPPQ